MMKWLVISMAVALVVGVSVSVPLEDRDEDALPTFKEAACPSEHSGYDLCLNVEYVDGTSEYLLLIKESGLATVLRGHPESKNTKVVVILADEDNSYDTIVFKSPHAPNCKQYSTQLKGDGQTECLKSAPHVHGQNADSVESRDAHLTDRSLFEQRVSPRALDRNGYKLDVVVYYDDMFNNEFSSRAKTRIAAVMTIVDEMYSEEDTLKTKIDVNLVASEHMPGKNWGNKKWSSELKTVGTYAQASRHEANLYVFLTGSKSDDGLGLAWLGTVCDSNRLERVSLDKYASGSSKGGDAYTAETIAHEMGHNLGMSHDCLEGNCATWSSSYKGPRKLNGVECYGYMDYKDNTQGWSVCSVDDFTKYINKQSRFCLPSRSGGGGGSGNGGGNSNNSGGNGGGNSNNSGGNCSDKRGDCSKYASFACNGASNKWFWKDCKKTCGKCSGGSSSGGGGGGGSNCKDKKGASTCQKYAGRGWCTTRYASWMADNCKKACRKC